MAFSGSPKIRADACRKNVCKEPYAPKARATGRRQKIVCKRLQIFDLLVARTISDEGLENFWQIARLADETGRALLKRCYVYEENENMRRTRKGTFAAVADGRLEGVDH